MRKFLELDRDLSDREKLFLADAIDAVARGMFGIALRAILDAHEPESSFSPSFKISPDQIKGINKDTLRKELQHSEVSPVQEIPIF